MVSKMNNDTFDCPLVGKTVTAKACGLPTLMDGGLLDRWKFTRKRNPFFQQLVCLQLHYNINVINYSTFITGRDDLKMCELSLDETGLTRKKNVEILAEEFESEWRRNGGQPYSRALTDL